MNQKTVTLLRQIGPKVDTNILIISRNLKAACITYRKKRTPKYVDKQLEEIPACAQRLYPTLSSNNFELLLDNEKYFLLYK